MILLALVALALGTVGFLEWADDRAPSDPKYKSYNFADAFYRAITLFGFAGAVDPPVNTPLQIARFLAPVLTGYAAIKGLTALFREQMQLMLIRVKMWNHTIVAGLGATGSRLATTFDQPDEGAGYPVVAIEANRGNPAIAGCRERGITVLVGDGADARILRRAGLNRARHLLVTCGRDRIDMDVLAAASKESERRRRGTLTVFVSLDDLDMWRRLTAAALAAPDRSVSFRREFFHVNDFAARMLLEAHPPFATRPAPGQTHVVLVGMGKTGESLVVHMAREWQEIRLQRDATFTLTLLGPMAGAHRSKLVSRYPDLASICEVRASDTPLDTLEPEAEAWLAGAARPLAVYICHDDELEGSKLALALAGHNAMQDVPITVAVGNEDAGAAKVLREGPQAVNAFGIRGNVLTPRLLTSGVNEMIAALMHEGYVRLEQAKGATRETNPVLVPWDQLSDETREANRAFVDGIGAKLRSVGCTIVPAPLIDPNGDLFQFEAKELELLAIEEHDRWAAHMRRAGIVGGPMRDAKHHPSLVDWQELSQDDKDKDRDAVRTIPRKLAFAGFRIVRLQEPPPSADGETSDFVGSRVADGEPLRQ